MYLQGDDVKDSVATQSIFIQLSVYNCIQYSLPYRQFFEARQ